MHTLRCITIGRMGFFLGVKTSKVMNFFVVRDLRLPASVSVFHPRKAANTFEPMTIASLAVRSILPMSSFTQISKTIVTLISVDVVNLVRRHFSCHVQPCKPVCSVALAHNLNMDISTTMNIACGTTDLNFWARYIPNKLASFWIVLKNAREFCKCHHAIIIPGCDWDYKTEGS